MKLSPFFFILVAFALLSVPAWPSKKEEQREQPQNYFWGVRDWKFIAMMNGEFDRAMTASMKVWGLEEMLQPAPAEPPAKWTAYIQAEMNCQPTEDGSMRCLVMITLRRPVTYKGETFLAAFRTKIVMCERNEAGRQIKEEISKIAGLYHDYQGASV